MNPTEWYRFGDGFLGVSSSDAPLNDRFRTVFAECRVSGSDVGEPSVTCTVAPSSVPGLTFVHFDDPKPLDVGRFVSALFADRSYTVEAEASGWSIIGGTAPGTVSGLAVRDPVVIVPEDAPWQGLIGNLAVNRVLRLQPETAFLHAASLVVGGAGVLITAPKAGGKTTVSSALAARGHGFLGDEMAAIRLASRQMLPFRRALSFRAGPRAASVQEALDRDPDPMVEQYPDGTPRRRAQPSRLFPDSSADGAPLRAVFVLESLGERAGIQRFEPTPADTGALAPFDSSQWGLPTGLRAMRLAGLLAGSACYRVNVGEADETAALIEHTVEDECL